MNIAFFGSSLVSAYWNGAATYYRGIVRALHERGHRVTLLRARRLRAPAAPRHRRPGLGEGRRLPARRRGRACCARSSRRAAPTWSSRRAASACSTRCSSARCSTLQAPGTLVVFWDVDAPATLDRMQARLPRDPFRALVPRYDLVLTYGGGEPVRRAYDALGARDCVPIYNALDPRTHLPVGARPALRRRPRLPRQPPARPRSARRGVLPARGGAAAASDASCSAAAAGTTRPMPANVQLPRPRLHGRPQRLQLHAAGGAQRQPRQHGALRLLAGDARVRGGRRRRLPDHRRVGGHRAVPRAGPRGAGGARRRRGGRARRSDSTPPRRARIGAGRAAAGAGASTPTRTARRSSRRCSRTRACARRTAAASELADAGRDGGMRIVILGLSITSSWGNGHATTYRGAGARAGAARPRRAVPRARRALVRGATATCPSPPYGRTALYASLDELRDALRRRGARRRPGDRRLVRARGRRGGRLGAAARPRGLTAFYDIDTPVTLAKLGARRVRVPAARA